MRTAGAHRALRTEPRNREALGIRLVSTAEQWLSSLRYIILGDVSHVFKKRSRSSRTKKERHLAEYQYVKSTISIGIQVHISAEEKVPRKAQTDGSYVPRKDQRRCGQGGGVLTLPDFSELFKQ